MDQRAIEPDEAAYRELLRHLIQKELAQRLGLSERTIEGWPEFAVGGERAGIDERFQDVVEGRGKACAYRWKRSWRDQPTARIGLGLEMSSFFRIAASSGPIRLA